MGEEGSVSRGKEVQGRTEEDGGIRVETTRPSFLSK